MAATDIADVRLDTGDAVHGLPRSSRCAKRALDIAGALVGLLLVLPLMLALAVLIKLDSPGPVIFRQTRVGRHGRRFQILKLRTMVADAEASKHELLDRNEGGGLFKIADDPRITGAGRWMRRCCVDELPQLLNVLRGEMSLVGPRPLVVEEDAKITGAGRRRLELTPGMTGRWQIGESRAPLDEMVAIDHGYAGEWSLWEDCRLLLRTVPYMLARRGM